MYIETFLFQHLPLVIFHEFKETPSFEVPDLKTTNTRSVLSLLREFSPETLKIKFINGEIRQSFTLVLITKLI